MLTALARAPAIALWLALSLRCFSANGGKVPDWFSPERPHQIYDAWKNLSGPESVIYLCCNSNVTAGVLRDEKGNALANVPVEWTQRIGRGGKMVVRMLTDANGYFIVYSPPDEFPGVKANPFDRPGGIYAIPGYPFSAVGFDFAVQKRAYRTCTVKLLKEDSGNKFYELTCSPGEPLAAEEFEEFVAKVTREKMEKGNYNYKADLEGPTNSSHEGRKRIEYHLRLVSDTGEPVPNAIVHFDSHDGVHQNPQTVKTDANGDCTVEEYLLRNREPEFYERIKRGLQVSVPGGVSGPLRPDLSAKRTNIFIIPKPGTVSGKIIISDATPLWNAEIAYPEFFLYNGSAESAIILPDGSYTFHRVMPNAKFSIYVQPNPWYRSPMPRAFTEELSLEPKETKTGVDLHIPQGVALAGIVVDQKGRPVTEKLQVRHTGKGRTGQFGNWFMGVQHAGAHRLTVTAEGYDPIETEIAELKPGELRFLRIELKGEGPVEPVYKSKELDLLRSLLPKTK